MMCANKYKLDNFVMILDNNGLQLDGTTDQIMPGLDMSKKAADFGFDTYDIDGHDMAQILDVFDRVRADAGNGKPKFINARTVKARAWTSWRTASTGTATLPTRSSTRTRWSSLRGGYEQWPRVI